MTVDTAAPTEVQAEPLTNCPKCGSHVLFTVELDYGGAEGFRPDFFGVVPETGDTITRCGDCAAFFVHDENGNVNGASAPPLETPAPVEENVESGGEAAAVTALNAIADELAGRVKELEAALEAERARADAAEAAPPAVAPVPDQPTEEATS